MFKNSILIQLSILIVSSQTALSQTIAVYYNDGRGTVNTLVSTVDSIRFAGSFSDIDGNTYMTIQIGDQTWMAENLKVTKYRNGDAITKVTDGPTWASLSTEAYCFYDNTDSNGDTYGALYNWYAVVDSRNIAPEGWHVPTDAEWTTLSTYLGGTSVAGGKLKETGTSHWIISNFGATNETGFTALPGGYRDESDGSYSTIGTEGLFWSATADGSLGAWLRRLANGSSHLDRDDAGNEGGCAIRCLRD